MKHFTKIMVAMTVLFGLYACSSEDDNSSSNNQETLADLYKKWEITSIATASFFSFSGSSNNIESIEFTDEGAFVIVYTDGEVATGNYTISPTNGTLDLGECGTININSLNDSMFSFSFQLTDETLNLVAQPAQEIPTNAANELMFRVWELQNLEAINVGSTEPSEIIVHSEILFTPYGTYLIKDDLQDGSIYVELSLWQWKNDQQKVVCYKPDDEGPFECDDDFFRIESLTASEFRILDLAGTEDEYELIFVPAN